MTLEAGTKLGRYEIRAKIGAGGMGEVYLAQDTQLDRTVALKILPAEIAADSQRLHRFSQEARAASKLKSANVAHIYEIGEAAGLRFIAMEYVEGKTLNEMIRGKHLAAESITRIGIEIAKALEEAHAKGITHRDIKPQNVIITPEGDVKVLDFGLAKVDLLSETAEEQAPDSKLSTRVKTNPGVVLGTVQYMSPEQALGREVDQRSDIFSLGIVLYEMTTGRLPFHGTSVTETVDKIAHTQPEPIARFNYNVPPELEVIIRKALRKNRDERYQTVREMLVDLRELQSELAFASRLEHSAVPDSPGEAVRRSTEEAAPKLGLEWSAPSTTQTSAPRATQSSAEYIVSHMKRHKTGAFLTLALALVACVGVGYAIYRLAFRGKPVVARFQNMKITKLTTTGNVSDTTISPDGKYVVYVVTEGKQKSLWTKYLPTGSTVHVVPPTEASLLGMTTFSPDGNFVYYSLRDKNNPNGTLFQVPVLGGTSKKVLENVSLPITFSPDGKRFAFLRLEFDYSKSSLVTANTDGTGERQLAAITGFEGFSGGPSWSPDGKMIACGTFSGKGVTVSSVAVDSGAITPLSSQRFSGSARVAWFKDGSGLVCSAREPGSNNPQVWQLSYPAGVVRRITNDLNAYSWSSLGVTADGSTIVTTQNEAEANIWLAPANSADAAHAKQITTRGQQLSGQQGLAWTADGKLVYSSVASGNYDIWIMNADGTGQKQLTDDPIFDIGPVVTPDGRYIVFYSGRSGSLNVWRMDIEGGNLKQLTTEQHLSSFDLTPDGQWVFYSMHEADKNVIRKTPIDGGTAAQIGVASNADSVSVSPDGQLLAYFGTDPKAGTTIQLVVISVAGGAPLKTFDVPVALGGGSTSFVLWSPDSRALLYLGTDPRGGAIGVWRQALDGGAPTLFANFADNIYTFAFSRDGKQIAFARGSQTSDAVLISEIK
jgi:serine/threonine protein kinase